MQNGENVPEDGIFSLIFLKRHFQGVYVVKRRIIFSDKILLPAVILLIKSRGTDMKQTIYIDVLFCVNFVIDYLILLTVRKFMNISCRLRRMLTGAAVGGICSFVILLPPVSSGLSIVAGIIIAGFVVAAAFCPIDKKTFLKTTAAFFLISFGYCGVMIAVLIIFSPSELLIRNNSVYIGISPIVLVIMSAVCYAVMRVILRITSRGTSEENNCFLEIKRQGKVISCRGKVDTGNSLHEPFSGDPVIVVKSSLFPDIGKQSDISHEDAVSRGFRMIPYNSVGGGGFLPAFRPEEIIISEKGIKHHVQGYIALCSQERITSETDALIPPELM